VLESESEVIRSRYGLTTRENTDALLRLAELELRLQSLRFDLFSDMRNLLRGFDEHSTCIWTGCDPYTTRAVSGVNGDGERSNCSRTNKDGVDYVKSEKTGFERYMALYFTPQEAGGCKGCRFFLMCKGQCPGTALDSDWRNRTEHCETWKTLYAVFERELLEHGSAPLSLSHRRKEIESTLITEWSLGRNSSIARTLQRLPTL